YPILPFGYYVSWAVLLRNFTHLDVLVAQGVNIIQPVPPYPDLDLIEYLLDRCAEMGIWVQYSMRHTYRDEKTVRIEVERIRKKAAVVGWYTADEPDGTSDSPTLSRTATDLIHSLDPYRPVTLVLNCLSHDLPLYASTTDILMTDVYPIGINSTFSNVYHTPCNATYGCCGCDGCLGEVKDVRVRLDAYAEEIWKAGGRGRVPTWMVLQALGGESFWKR
ncbi:hypothetical protein BDK51DRAFT_24630, partial [Blyttiomyces helicus]